jgi:mono/diheme cytochrome c family protein
VSAQAPARQPTIKREAARTIASVEGKDTYDAYCAVCHGKDLKGNGPAAPALKVPTPDLTLLAKNNGGKFSPMSVQETVEGKGKPLSAHGSSDMPIWGPIFRAMNQDDAMKTLRVSNLVKYIESMQAK